MEKQVVGPVLDETILNTGLQALQRALGSGELLQFPTRPSGAPLLLRQRFFERLFGEPDADLSDCSSGDLTAAQGDVSKLGLTQLLHLRCGHLEAPRSGAAQTDFQNAVSSALTPKLVERLAAGGVEVDAMEAEEVARGALRCYGVAEQLPTSAPGRPEHFLLRAGSVEAVLHLPTCSLCEPASVASTPVLAASNLSRATTNAPSARRRLHWEVEVCEDISAFKEKAPQAGSATERRNAKLRRPGAGQAEADAASEATTVASASSSAELLAAQRRIEELERTLKDLTAQVQGAQAAASLAAERAQALQAAEAGNATLREELAQEKSAHVATVEAAALADEKASARIEALEAQLAAQAAAASSSTGKALDEAAAPQAASQAAVQKEGGDGASLPKNSCFTISLAAGGVADVWQAAVELGTLRTRVQELGCLSSLPPVLLTPGKGGASLCATGAGAASLGDAMFSAPSAAELEAQVGQ